MEELFVAYLQLKGYCFAHQCNSNCAFFLLGGGCELCQNKKPRFWKEGAFLLKREEKSQGGD